MLLVLNLLVKTMAELLFVDVMVRNSIPIASLRSLIHALDRSLFSVII